ncbi:MAG TPA: uroporphyrinogen-III C-methyltransferase [Acidimicrobiales bacterium]|nr:uroporphyrinogen-III C-methyltransferase [Acidimicrobiales bacterium]
MTVYLVGAGPGDPGLMTRRGAEVLGRAEVVVFDRLVPRVLVELAPAAALRLDMGKRPGMRGRQEEIHAALIEHGAAGKTVVRLKGGDPFVFGRGSEEVEALRAAGVDYEVVPGVSSAFAVAASAGVPVTHRGLSTSVTVVTGHVGDPSAPGGVDWEALARAGGTIVILMGMEHRAEIAELLMAGGRPAGTPVLVVQWGSTPAERSVRGTLADLDAVDLGAPATIVVGAVAGLDLRPGRPPLSGVTVVVTRPRLQAEGLVAGLAGAGASVIMLPVIAVADAADGGPLDEAAGRADRYDWIVFTSVNAVDRFVSRLRDGRALGRVRLAAVGPATAAALARWHLVADLVAAGPGAAGLVTAMPDAPTGAGRVLFPRAAGAGELLAGGLRDKGWEVDEVEAYRTVGATVSDGATADALEAAAEADVVTFSSPSAVSGYLALAGGRVPAVVACIGPSTAEAAEAAGLVVDVVADEQTDEGLIAALIHRYER